MALLHVLPMTLVSQVKVKDVFSSPGLVPLGLPTREIASASSSIDLHVIDYVTVHSLLYYCKAQCTMLYIPGIPDPLEDHFPLVGSRLTSNLLTKPLGCSVGGMCDMDR